MARVTMRGPGRRQSERERKREARPNQDERPDLMAPFPMDIYDSTLLRAALEALGCTVAAGIMEHSIGRTVGMDILTEIDLLTKKLAMWEDQ